MATNAVLATLTAITSIVVARFFGEEVRGQFATVTALLNTSVSVAVLGTPAFIAKYVANNERGQVQNDIDVFRAVIFLTALCSLTAILFMALLNFRAMAFPVEPISRLAIALFIPCGVLSILLLNISLGQANWRSFNLSRLLFAGGTVGAVTVYFLMDGVSLSGLIVCLAIANGLAVMAQLLLLRPVNRNMAGWWQSGRAAIVGSRYYALNSIVNVTSGYADIIVLSYLFTPSQVGFWAVARSIAALLSPINNALSVKIFSTFAREEQDGMAYFPKLLRNFMAFNAISAAIIYIMAHTLIVVIFGAGFFNSVALVPYALLLVVASSFSELIEERLRGSGTPGPVNISRLAPILVLLCVFVFAQDLTEFRQIAIYLALGQCLRGSLAVMLLLALTRRDR